MRLGGRRILIVEDEYFLAEEMAREFRQAGAEVFGPVADVEGAMRILAQEPGLDGVVLDINLHGEMAYPVADALIERHLPFVFATGYDRWSIPAPYAGVRRCEKPVQAFEVADVLFGPA